MKKVLYLLLIVFAMFSLVACSDESDKAEEKTPVEIVLDNIKLNDLTVKYDGEVHNLTIENLPEGLTIAYIGNSAVEVGEHRVMAFVMDEEGTIVLTLEATITILSPDAETPSVPSDDLSDVKFSDQTFIHDGKNHSIYVTNLPQEFTVTYVGNEVKEVGTHTVTAKIFNSNNELVLELSATITISQGSEVELPLV